MYKRQALARLVYAGSRRGEVQGNLVGRPVSLAAERVEKVRGGLALARRTAVHSNRGKTHAKALLLRLFSWCRVVWGTG